MKNIKLLKLEKYNDLSEYQIIEDGVYKDLEDKESTNIRIALSFELEIGENEQYPIEDILDKYYLHVSEFLENNNINNQNDSILNLELAGELEDVLNVKSLIGKRVYNEADHNNRLNLIIE